MSSWILDAAKKTARYHLSKGTVEAVWLFGGIAKTGTSNHDIDIIFGVKEEIAIRFINEIFQFAMALTQDSTYPQDNPWIVMRKRFQLAESLLGNTKPMDLYIRRPFSEKNIPLDIFLLPIDWQSRIPELEQYFPTNDEGLLSRINLDAARFDTQIDNFIGRNGQPLTF